MDVISFNRDTPFWNEFYKQYPPSSMSPSRFADFCCKYVEKGKTLVDIGCGNGRDSLYFNQLGLNVIGIDASDSVISALNKLSSDRLSFVCGDFTCDSRVFAGGVDYYYSRFTLHAVNCEGEDDLLRNVKESLIEGGLFFIEVRSIHDEKFGKGERVGRNSYNLDGHYRRFVVMEELLVKLIKLGFSIKYAEEEKGFAPYKEEDSEIIRIVAIKGAFLINAQ